MLVDVSAPKCNKVVTPDLPLSRSIKALAALHVSKESDPVIQGLCRKYTNLTIIIFKDGKRFALEMAQVG